MRQNGVIGQAGRFSLQIAARGRINAIDNIHAVTPYPKEFPIAKVSQPSQLFLFGRRDD